MATLTTSSPSAYRPVYTPSTPSGIQDELWISAQCRKALACLDRALVAPPLQFSREVGSVVRILTQVRGKIADNLRQNPKSVENAQLERAYTRLSSAVMLIAGLAFPGGPVRRKPVEQARELLNDVLVDGLF